MQRIPCCGALCAQRGYALPGLALQWFRLNPLGSAGWRAAHGHIALIGVLTGRAGEVPTGALMAKQATLQGLIVGSRRDQIEMVRAIESTGLHPVVDRSFPLDNIADAFRHEESQRHFGKICLEV